MPCNRWIRVAAVMMGAGTVGTYGPPVALITPAFAAADAVEAADVVAENGPVKIRIGHIKASGTRLTRDDLIKIASGQFLADGGSRGGLSPDVFAQRLARYTADAIDISDATIDLTTPLLTQRIHCEHVAMRRVDKGRIGELSVDRTTIAAKYPQLPLPMAASIATIRGQTVDVGLAARIAREPRERPDEAPGVIYGEMRLDDLQATIGETFRVSVGGVTARGVKARRLSTPPTVLAETQRALMAGGRLPQGAAKPYWAFLADYYQGVEVATFEVRDVAGAAPDGKGGSFTLARFAIADVAKARVGKIAYEGLEVRAPDVKVSLGSFALHGVDASPILAALAKVAPDPTTMAGMRPRALIPIIDGITVANVDFDANDRGAATNGGTRTRFTIGKIAIEAKNYVMGIPTSLSLVVDNDVIDPGVEKLREIGFARDDFSMAFHAAWNEADNTIELKALSLAGVGMGRASLTGTIGNVTRDLFDDVPAVAQSAALAARVKSASLRIENDGLFEKALTALAARNGTTSSAERTRLVRAEETSIRTRFGGGPAVETLIGAVTAFIEDPKSLDLAVAAPIGIGLAEVPLFQTPAELMKRLEIKATANR